MEEQRNVNQGMNEVVPEPSPSGVGMDVQVSGAANPELAHSPLSGNFIHAEPDVPIQQKMPDIPLELISSQAVIKVLLAKGLVSLQELSRAEYALRAQKQQERHASSHNGNGTKKHRTYSYGHAYSKDSHHHSKHRWLRKKMAKHRWSRRLGTALFGWKWKRVSKDPHVPLIK